MINSRVFPRRRVRGFTLVELLVVILIVVTLATLVFVLARNGLAKAASSKSLSHLRQSGFILLADAQEKNGKMQYFGGGGSAGFDIRHYNIVRTVTGLRVSGGTANRGDLCEIMHWNPDKLKPSNYHWNCFAINFTNVPDLGVQWLNENITTPVSHSARTLIPASVTRPDAYPFLIDSSTSAGDEIFRILESNGDCVGLRNSGKANALFLDGSARSLGRSELKKAGFTKAYDNRTRPPRLIPL